MPAPDFRAAINTAMDRRGMKRAKLAELSGVPYASIYDYTTGKGGLTADNLARLCGVLGIDVKLPRGKSDSRQKIENQT
jgi:transcriptional regulator with XRE-family HTH domain